jgi:hypothetical protein
MKQLTEQQEVDNVVHMYFAHMKGRYFIEMLKSFARGRGYGMESTCCIFSFEYQPKDEEYFGDSGVQISRTFPNEEFAILSYDEFYRYLVEEIKKYPDKSIEINEHMEEIKKILNL